LRSKEAPAADIDYWVTVLNRVCGEAYKNPDILREALPNASIHTVEAALFDDPNRWAMNWRAYRRKLK
jgi:glycine dehydrogenase subunit 2